MPTKLALSEVRLVCERVLRATGSLSTLGGGAGALCGDTGAGPVGDCACDG